jgi:hypothetical protein
MSTHILRPWTDCVKLHDDVITGALTESTFAIDLGAVAAGDADVPAVYRDPRAFFRATYFTTELLKLLDEVLASLAGRRGHNRVLKLRSPFGGGKSHTLAALLHSARSRKALSECPEAASLANPADVVVAVFDGEKFGTLGKPVGDGLTVQTMWGWLAWQIDPERAYPLVASLDRDRVAPSGDEIKALLTQGAAGRPVLILLDEVLKYMERTAAVAVHDSTLQRQAKDFFQNLTVEVANSRNAVLVYSLTSFTREAFGNIALLEELDKLAARVDQLREPVGGDEVLPILQRRLLDEPPPAKTAEAVADAYAGVIAAMRRAYADSERERREADEAGLALRERIRSAYPFHPSLIDIMKERWTSVENYQRTRGALRFLAACLRALKRHGGAGAILGPGDVLLRDAELRTCLLNDLGVQHDFDPVLAADIAGANARVRQIDERLARENPHLASVRPASRLATIVLLCSFGGLRREAKGTSEPLPPGVTESELLTAAVTPELDSLTATAVLTELRNTCLYLHYDGSRYCFKKDPNVTKLVEDAEQAIAREESQGAGPVRTRIREMLETRLGKQPAEVWPAKSQDIPDRDPRFLVAYLPLEFANEPQDEQGRIATELLYQYGDQPRRYRNGLGLAVPERKPVESLRRAVRYLLAVERVDAKRHEHRLTKDQIDQLKERKRSEEAAAEASLRELYLSVWLPRMEKGEPSIEKVEKSGRPLQATGLHERIMELLTAQGSPKAHSTVTPRKIVERLKLGESASPGGPPRYGVKTSDVQDAFFGFLEPPRLSALSVLRAAIVRGIREGAFGYLSGSAPAVGSDGKFQVSREKVRFKDSLAEDEVDFETGFLICPSAVPEETVVVCPRCGQTPCRCVEPLCPRCGKRPCTCTGPACPQCGKWPCACPTVKRHITLTFRATRSQLFKAFHALANLADKSEDGQVTVRIDTTSAANTGYDPSWLRNAVEEPLDEAGIHLEES